jgi:hypothetical protein
MLLDVLAQLQELSFQTVQLAQQARRHITSEERHALTQDKHTHTHVDMTRISGVHWTR